MLYLCVICAIYHMESSYVETISAVVDWRVWYGQGTRPRLGTTNKIYRGIYGILYIYISCAAFRCRIAWGYLYTYIRKCNYSSAGADGSQELIISTYPLTAEPVVCRHLLIFSHQYYPVQHR